MNPSGSGSDRYWVERVNETWKEKDGRQKIHYSLQDKNKKPGSHSATVDAEIFSDFYREVGGNKIDIMLEVKDKNLSAVKCINALERSDISELEKEWARYKYLVLEHSPSAYNKIRELLKDKKAYPVLEFYDLIDKALSEEEASGQIVNAAEHVWGYFSRAADKKTGDKIRKLILKAAEEGRSAQLKKMLWKLAEERDSGYLLQSLYFKDIL